MYVGSATVVIIFLVMLVIAMACRWAYKRGKDDGEHHKHWFWDSW